jgi:hypothetical protein
MKRHDTELHCSIRRLRRLLRKAQRNGSASPHLDHARYIGALAGELFRLKEQHEGWAGRPPSPRLREIQERIRRGDATNADNDRFWLVNYIEGFVLVPADEFDMDNHRGVPYVIP